MFIGTETRSSTGRGLNWQIPVCSSFWSQIVFCSWECSCHTTWETTPSCKPLCFLRGLHQHLSNRPLRRLSICEGLSWPLPVIKRLSRVKRWLEQSSVSFLYFAFPNSKPRLRLLPLFVSGRSCCVTALANDKVVILLQLMVGSQVCAILLSHLQPSSISHSIIACVFFRRETSPLL